MKLTLKNMVVSTDSGIGDGAFELTIGHEIYEAEGDDPNKDDIDLFMTFDNDPEFVDTGSHMLILSGYEQIYMLKQHLETVLALFDRHTRSAAEKDSGI